MRLDGLPWPRLGRFGLVLALHGVALAWLASLATRPPEHEARPMTMRLLASEPRPAAPTPRIEPPKPKAEPPRPQPARPIAQPSPAPVLAAAAAAPAAAPVFAVAPQPLAAPPAPAVTAAPAPVTAARFDAEYLHNPKPVYPALSRRLGEEGRVVLKVAVRADGTAESVEVATSSGYPRLDQAALDAVQRWRFIPARRGDQPVPGSVRVPLLFRLDEG